MGSEQYCVDTAAPGGQFHAEPEHNWPVSDGGASPVMAALSTAPLPGQPFADTGPSCMTLKKHTLIFSDSLSLSQTVVTGRLKANSHQTHLCEKNK